MGRIIYDKAIRELLREKTVILITHHLGYAKEADNVIVFKDGSIEAEGELEQLMNRNLDILQIFAEEEKKAEENEGIITEEKTLVESQEEYTSFVHEGGMTSNEIQGSKAGRNNARN